MDLQQLYIQNVCSPGKYVVTIDTESGCTPIGVEPIENLLWGIDIVETIKARLAQPSVDPILAAEIMTVVNTNQEQIVTMINNAITKITNIDGSIFELNLSWNLVTLSIDNVVIDSFDLEAAVKGFETQTSLDLVDVTNNGLVVSVQVDYRWEDGVLQTQTDDVDLNQAVEDKVIANTDSVTGQATGKTIATHTAVDNSVFAIKETITGFSDTTNGLSYTKEDGTNDDLSIESQTNVMELRLNGVVTDTAAIVNSNVLAFDLTNPLVPLLVSNVNTISSSIDIAPLVTPVITAQVPALVTSGINAQVPSIVTSIAARKFSMEVVTDAWVPTPATHNLNTGIYIAQLVDTATDTFVNDATILITDLNNTMITTTNAGTYRLIIIY